MNEEYREAYPKCEICQSIELALFKLKKDSKLLCGKCLEIDRLNPELEVIESKPDFKGDSTPIGIREIPNYYKGKYLGIRARDIMMDYELSYNVGTAVTYLLRAGKKEGNSYQQDLEKAIHHLSFALEDLKNNNVK